MVKGLIIVILGILIIPNGSVSETPDIVITVTPTKETIIASTFSAKDNFYYELIEYETTDNIVLSSQRTLNLNESSILKGRIIGIKNGKYVFSVENILFNICGLIIYT